jgi:hypothetical protein
LQEYFKNGKLPDVRVLTYLPEIPLPPMKQPQNSLPELWVELLGTVFVSFMVSSMANSGF